MNVSNSEGALEAVGVWAPPFSTFSVGVSPLVQKAVQREENKLKFPQAPRLCGSHISVGASLLVQNSFLNLWENQLHD